MRVRAEVRVAWNLPAGSPSPTPGCGARQLILDEATWALLERLPAWAIWHPELAATVDRYAGELVLSDDAVAMLCGELRAHDKLAAAYGADR